MKKETLPPPANFNCGNDLSQDLSKGNPIFEVFKLLCKEKDLFKNLEENICCEIASLDNKDVLRLNDNLSQLQTLILKQTLENLVYKKECLNNIEEILSGKIA
ncbi:MAG: hypothetical protein ACI3YC_02230 [Alloprevotella sp.]